MMNIWEKLCKIQSEMKVPKTEFNPFGNFNYRSAEGILQIVKPLCLKHEVTLILTDSIEVIEGRLFAKTVAELIDWTVDGESANKVVSMPGFAEFPSLKAKTDEAQRTGIAFSYAKKRALESLFNLSTEKDSDAIPPDKEVEKQDAMQKNQAKLDAMENWRIFDGGVVLVKAKTRNGDFEWKNLEEIPLKGLEYLKTDARFEGIGSFVDKRIAIIKGNK